jgi:anti-anti-sigma factor
MTDTWGADDSGGWVADGSGAGPDGDDRRRSSGADGASSQDLMSEHSIKVVRAARYSLVAVSGEIDLSNAHLIKQAIDAALRDNGHHLVVDLSDVRFMDSSGLKVLIATAANLPLGSVVVVASRPSICRIFAITGTESIIPVVPSLAEATVRWTEDPDTVS